ncbi:hypothetical protein BGZ47_011063 [Haplosporangium gracile]|nr:hypothetical protein BGZ47_011063 [Haplosporangium gracile]
MAPAMPGMPIIPPRLQQQQQQEMLINNRRQHPHLYQQQQYPQQFRPTHIPGGGGPFPFTGHTRSVSNGGGPSAPSNNYSSNNNRRPLNGPIGSNSNNYSHQQSSNNYGSGNGGHNLQQQQQGPGGRLRSESNPSYSSSSNNNPNSSLYSSGSSNGVPSRANSSGTAASGTSFQDRMKERDRERQGRERERDEREAAAARVIREDPKFSGATPTNSTTVTTTAAAAKEAAAAAAATAQSTGTALWNRMRAAKDAINVAITGEERWPDSDDSDYEGESHVSRVLREYSDKKKIEELDPAQAATTGIGSYGTPFDTSTVASQTITHIHRHLSRHRRLRVIILVGLAELEEKPDTSHLDLMTLLPPLPRSGL